MDTEKRKIIFKRKKNISNLIQKYEESKENEKNETALVLQPSKFLNPMKTKYFIYPVVKIKRFFFCKINSFYL
jgi:hypothetical protein